MWQGQGQSHQRKESVQGVSDPVRNIKGPSTDVFETLQTKIYIHIKSVSEIFMCLALFMISVKPMSISSVNAHGHVTNFKNIVRLSRDATMWLQFRANFAGRYIEMRMRLVHLNMRTEGITAFSKRIRHYSVDGENDTKTISVDANRFENRKKTAAFSFENGLVWRGSKGPSTDVFETLLTKIYIHVRSLHLGHFRII